MIYLYLAYEFFKTGLLAVGGGLATIPFLARMSENHPDWFSISQLADMIAVSESTPGPMGINMASYVGYTVGGVLGSVIATLSIVLPSLLVIMTVAKFMEKYMNSSPVERTFSALRPAVTGLIAAAGWTVLKTSVFVSGDIVLSSLSAFLSNIDLASLALFAVILILTQLKPLKKLHPILFIVAGAAAGIVFKL